MAVGAILLALSAGAVESPTDTVARVRAAAQHSAVADARLYQAVAVASGLDYFNKRASGQTAEDKLLDMRRMAHNETLKDEAMHMASDWHYFDATSWVQYCAPLFHDHRERLAARPALFVEFGSGVGAFARVVLRRFPLSAGVGITLGAKELRVARQMLRAYEDGGRFVSVQGDMQEQPLPPKFAALAGRVDHVFVPGSLLFARDFRHVHAVLQNAMRLLRPGGHLTANTIPESEAGRGSGHLVIPRRFFVAEAARCGCFEVAKLVSGGESLAAPVTPFASARAAEAHFHLRQRIFVDLAKRRGNLTRREQTQCERCPAQEQGRFGERPPSPKRGAAADRWWRWRPPWLDAAKRRPGALHGALPRPGAIPDRQAVHSKSNTLSDSRRSRF
jgi:SAM-dependent methyltransferase